MNIKMLMITYLVECRLPEPQICRPVPRKPSFLMESLTREGLNKVAASDVQPSQPLSARYLLELYGLSCVLCLMVIFQVNLG